MAKVDTGDELKQMASIALLQDEAVGLMQELGITTISFYKGDSKRALDIIKAQLSKVVESNPWLCAHLDGKDMKFPAVPTSGDLDNICISQKSPLTSKGSYVTICTEIYKHKLNVPDGYTLLKTKGPCTSLKILEMDDNEFAVVFSMSHVIADGRTYYDVLNMLTPGADVVALVSTRVDSFRENMRKLCGEKELVWADSPGAMAMYTFAMMPNDICGKVSCSGFYVDEEKNTAAKTAGAKEGGVAYVSTNDVLTSGFMTVTNSRIGMMGLDCRGKVSGIGQDFAGNYVSALSLDDTTFGTPASLRKMLSTTPYKPTTKPLPGFCRWMVGLDSANFSMVTNWSSFARNLMQLTDCDLQVHLPVHNPAYCMYDLMVPFTPAPGKVGVICWTTKADEDALKTAMPLGDRISNELFP